MGSFRNSEIGTLDAADDTVSLAWRHFDNGGVGVQMAGTLSGTVKIEGTIDGANWVALAFINAATGALVAGATGFTANGIYRTEAVGLLKVRVKCTAYTSGTGSVTLVALSN
jgi:hypothetical protein